MKLFITGGAGFIGSNFIRHWMDNHPDDEIVNFDLLTYAGNLENLNGYSDRPNYTFVKGDIREAGQVLPAMAGADFVVHFAAESHVDRSITHPSEFVTTNVLGTQVLLECALKNNIKRFHHISTDEVFGSLELDSKVIFDEHTPYDPRSPYSASKAGSDHLVRAYHETFGLTYTLTNCSNNYGPFHFPEKFIPLAITNLLENKKIPIYGDGKNVRDWLFVTDHCRAIEAVLLHGKDNETYCVGGLKNDVSNLEIAHMLLKIMGKDESYLSYVNDRPGHDRRYAINWDKIYTKLDWEPQVTLEQGLEQTVKWYQDHEDWWKRVRSGEYQAYYNQQYGDRTERNA